MITIVGDSYCYFYDEGSWPWHLGQLLSMPVKTYSSSGCSWWATRRQVTQEAKLGNFKESKIVIFCHTEGSRIPNKNDSPIGGFSVEHKFSSLPSAEIKAAKLYYEHLHDPEFFTWAQQKWLDECISFFPKDAFFIHLHCFPYSFLKLTTPGNVNISPPLYAFSEGEFKTKEEHFAYLKAHSYDIRKNHLNAHNNLALAKELAVIVKNKFLGNYELTIDNFDLKNLNAIKANTTGTGGILCNGRSI